MSLIVIDPIEYNIEIDLLYGTSNNFMKKAIYNNPVLMLHEDAAKCLLKASQMAIKFGYKLKIFDGYRPIEAQQIMYDMFPGTNYVSDPVDGIATHTRGVAVDLTLIKATDYIELDMGTEFDSFKDAAHHFSDKIGKEAVLNRGILIHIMLSAGFELYKYEWWHYQLPNPKNYPKISDKDNNIRMME